MIQILFFTLFFAVGASVADRFENNRIIFKSYPFFLSLGIESKDGMTSNFPMLFATYSQSTVIFDCGQASPNFKCSNIKECDDKKGTTLLSDFLYDERNMQNYFIDLDINQNNYKFFPTGFASDCKKFQRALENYNSANGIFGLSWRGPAFGPLSSDGKFSLYIKENENNKIQGEFIIGEDDSLKVLTEFGFHFTDVTDNWEIITERIWINEETYLTEENKKFSIEITSPGKTVFDHNIQNIIFPSNVYKTFIENMKDKYGLKCQHEYHDCALEGDIDSFPTIFIESPNKALPLLPKLYLTKISETTAMLNIFPSCVEEAKNCIKVVEKYKNHFILDYHVMSYYYIVFKEFEMKSEIIVNRAKKIETIVDKTVQTLELWPFLFQGILMVILVSCIAWFFYRRCQKRKALLENNEEHTEEKYQTKRKNKFNYNQLSLDEESNELFD